MKHLFLLALAVLTWSCNSDLQNASVNAGDVYVSGNSQNPQLPQLSFDAEVFNFGLLTQGEKVSHDFYFKNTGKKPLIISAAEGSCGCTVPEYPKDPIAPGESGVIKVTFNTESKSGTQEKTVTLVTNCEPSTRLLRIQAEIVVAKAASN